MQLVEWKWFLSAVCFLICHRTAEQRTNYGAHLRFVSYYNVYVYSMYTSHPSPPIDNIWVTPLTGAHVSLLVFCCNYVCISYHFWDIHCQMGGLEIWVRGQSRSLEIYVAPFDRSHTSFYWCSIVTMALSCIMSDKKWNISFKKLQIFRTPALDCPVRRVSVGTLS